MALNTTNLPHTTPQTSSMPKLILSYTCSDPNIDPHLRRKCYGWSAGCGNCMYVYLKNMCPFGKLAGFPLNIYLKTYSIIHHVQYMTKCIQSRCGCPPILPHPVKFPVKLRRGGWSIPGTLCRMFSLAVLLFGLIISTIYVFCPDH